MPCFVQAHGSPAPLWTRQKNKVLFIHVILPFILTGDRATSYNVYSKLFIEDITMNLLSLMNIGMRFRLLSDSNVSWDRVMGQVCHWPWRALVEVILQDCHGDVPKWGIQRPWHSAGAARAGIWRYTEHLKNIISDDIGKDRDGCEHHS